MGERMEVFGRLTNRRPVMADRAHNLKLGHTRAVARRYCKTVTTRTSRVFDRGLAAGVLL